MAARGLMRSTVTPAAASSPSWTIWPLTMMNRLAGLSEWTAPFTLKGGQSRRCSALNAASVEAAEELLEQRNALEQQLAALAAAAPCGGGGREE